MDQSHCRIVFCSPCLNIDLMTRLEQMGALKAVLQEAARCVVFLALVWRVVLPSGPFLGVDAQGKFVELCALTGLVLVKSDSHDGAPTKATDHCPLAMAGVVGTPPPLPNLTPPLTLGAAETVHFVQRIQDNAPFRASPPRGPPALQA